MRTKPLDGVLLLDVVGQDPPEVYIAYDGLAGLSLRPMIRDIVDELQRKGPEALSAFLAAVKRRGWARVYVYFSDYVSYGIGGGDATAEFLFGTVYVRYFAAEQVVENGQTYAVPPRLVLQRPDGVETFSLEGTV